MQLLVPYRSRTINTDLKQFSLVDNPLYPSVIFNLNLLVFVRNFAKFHETRDDLKPRSIKICFVFICYQFNVKHNVCKKARVFSTSVRLAGGAARNVCHFRTISGPCFGAIRSALDNLISQQNETTHNPFNTKYISNSLLSCWIDC